MLVRSPRRVAVLCSISFLLVLVVLHNSPWAQERVYKQLPLFIVKDRPALASVPALNHDRLESHPKHGWQHAASTATPGGTDMVAMEDEAANTSQKILSDDWLSAASHPPWVTAPSRTEHVAPSNLQPTDLKHYMESMLDWSRPTWDGHWPPFQDYVDKKYDPNRWEQFDM
jgi:hypothetical protein